MTVVRDQTPCPNCDTARTGRYCANCGQDNRRSRLRLHEQLLDTVDALFGVDSRTVRTVRELSLGPGGVVRRYTAGARIRYMSPLRYAVATAALWWLVVQMQLPDLSQVQRPLRIALTYGQPINLALLLPLTVPQWLAFLGTRTTFAAHLCGVLFVCGHMFLVRAGLALLGSWQPKWGPTLNSIDPWLFGSFFAWAIWQWQRPASRQVLPHVVLAVRTGVALLLFFLASAVLSREVVSLLAKL